MELNNKIFSWKGGGYSGCLWEPNLGFVDETGVWHPSVSTGYNGISSKEDLEEYLENGDDGRGIQVLDLTQDSINLLCKTIRNDYVAELVDSINSHAARHKMERLKMVCSECGKLFRSEYEDFRTHIAVMTMDGFYHGDGGIGIMCSDILCDDCICLKTEEQEDSVD